MTTSQKQPRKEENALWRKVRAELVHRDLTQSDLASALGIHRNTIRLALCSNLCQPARKRILQYLKLAA